MTDYSLGEAFRGVLAARIGPNGLFSVLDGFKRTDAEIAAGVTPTNYTASALTPPRYGVVADSAATDDTAAWVTAISVAAQTVGGATGATVDASSVTGLTKVSSQIVLPNRVRVVGPNASGLIFTASASHAGPYVFYAQNGTSSMFDSILQDLYIDCSNVASLGAVQTDAWQENSGIRRVGVKNVRGIGLHVQHGYGGAATLEVQQTQWFASSLGCADMIKIDQISSIGGFLFHLRDSVIAGVGVANTITRGLNMVKDSAFVENVHFEDCTSAIYLDGAGSHTLINCTGGSTTTTLVEIAATFTGSLTMIGCHRNGATNFLKDTRAGGMGTINYDVSHLHIDTNSLPYMGVGAIWSAGYFDGTSGASPVVTGFNVASCARNSTGNYTITEALGRPTVACAPWATCNLADAIVQTNLVGANTYNIVVRVAGVATNASEIKFGNVRLI